MKLDRFQEGSVCYLVFKTQPFAPTPNPQTRTVDMLLNLVSGKYHGFADDSNKSFLFETEANHGAVMWEVDVDSVLMVGTRTNSSDIAKV